MTEAFRCLGRTVPLCLIVVALCIRTKKNPMGGVPPHVVAHSFECAGSNTGHKLRCRVGGQYFDGSKCTSMIQCTSWQCITVLPDQQVPFCLA
jgi:hypothetical protein